MENEPGILLGFLERAESSRYAKVDLSPNDAETRRAGQSRVEGWACPDGRGDRPDSIGRPHQATRWQAGSPARISLADGRHLSPCSILKTAMALPLLSSHPTRAGRHVYAQSYRRIEIFADIVTDQFFINGSPGEQFATLALCEDEIDRRMDRERPASPKIERSWS